MGSTKQSNLKNRSPLDVSSGKNYSTKVHLRRIDVFAWNLHKAVLAHDSPQLYAVDTFVCRLKIEGVKQVKPRFLIFPFFFFSRFGSCAHTIF